MQRFLVGLAVTVVLAIVGGCGGGGGGTVSGPATLSSLPQELIGTYAVSGLGLPNNQLAVQSNGDVVVNSDGVITRTRTRATAAVKVGTCSADGSINLNGKWYSNGYEYEIIGSGRVNVGAVSLDATVKQKENGKDKLVYEETDAGGVKVGDLEYPPPPPSWEEGNGNDGDDEFIPPPPPEQ